MLWDFKTDSTTLGNQVVTFGRPRSCSQQRGVEGRGVSVGGAARGKAGEHKARDAGILDSAAGVSRIEVGGCVGGAGAGRDNKNGPSDEGLIQSSSSGTRDRLLSPNTRSTAVAASSGPAPDLDGDKEKNSPALVQRNPPARDKRALSPPRDPRLPRTFAERQGLSANDGGMIQGAGHRGLLCMACCL
jgi:hypothetical protein